MSRGSVNCCPVWHSAGGGGGDSASIVWVRPADVQRESSSLRRAPSYSNTPRPSDRLSVPGSEDFDSLAATGVAAVPFGESSQVMVGASGVRSIFTYGIGVMIGSTHSTFLMHMSLPTLCKASMSLVLRHSSRITRFGMHVVACCCDCDIIWTTSIHLGTLDTLILHFTSILYYSYTSFLY